MKQGFFDKLNSIILIAGFGFFTLTLFVVVILPVLDPVNSKPSENLLPYTEEELRGRNLYISEGCWLCHTQFVRPVGGDQERYGQVSEAGETVYDKPHLFGTRRIGPDLARVGKKYSDEWHFQHLFNPRAIVPGSIMPAYTWYFDKDPAKPNKDAKAIVAYLQKLGTGIGRKREAQPAKAENDVKSLINAGKTVFAANCSPCHGQKGVPTLPGAANFTDEEWVHGGRMEDIIHIITQGTPKGMPQWTGRLSDAQIKQAAYFVKSLSPSGKKEMGVE